jgi:hypothetical protein
VLDVQFMGYNVKLAGLGHRLRLGWELTLTQFCFVLSLLLYIYLFINNHMPCGIYHNHVFPSLRNSEYIVTSRNEQHWIIVISCRVVVARFNIHNLKAVNARSSFPVEHALIPIVLDETTRDHIDSSWSKAVDMRSNVLQDRDVEANIFNHVELWHATS